MDPRNPTPRYIVMDARACMPSSCYGGTRYRRVAVVEVVPGAPPPKMISPRARDVVRIVRTWERVYSGTTARCAYRVALAKALALASELNDRAVVSS